MFKAEGTFEVTIVEATAKECRFKAKENELNNRNEYVQCWYDVALLVQDAQGNNDTWSGEMSNRTGMGNSADKYRWELTLKTLQDIGFNVRTMQELEMQFQPAADRTIFIPNLVGIKCKVVTENRTYKKQDGTEGHAIRIKYLNGLNSDAGGKTLNFDEFMAARRGSAPQPAAAPMPAPSAPAMMPPATAPVQTAANGYAVPQQPAPYPAAAPAAPQQVPQPPAMMPPPRTVCPY